jgi:hypothetical protein
MLADDSISAQTSIKGFVQSGMIIGDFIPRRLHIARVSPIGNECPPERDIIAVIKGHCMKEREFLVSLTVFCS